MIDPESQLPVVILSDNERQYYSKLFSLADKDHDGYISPAEAKFFTKCRGVTESDLHEVWNLVTNNCNLLKLNKNAFCAAIKIISLLQEGNRTILKMRQTDIFREIMAGKDKIPIFDDAMFPHNNHNPSTTNGHTKSDSNFFNNHNYNNNNSTFNGHSATNFHTNGHTGFWDGKGFISDNESPPIITHGYKKFSSNVFNQILLQYNSPGLFMGGNIAANYFSSSGLSKENLSIIWNLSDIDSDGKLDVHEFSLAHYLVHLGLRKKSLHTLPPSLKTTYKINPESVDNLSIEEVYTIADGSVKAGDSDNSLYYLNYSIEKCVNLLSNAFIKQSTLKMQAQNIEGAIDDLNKALLYNPNYVLAYNQRCQCYIQIGQYQKAQDDMQHILQQQPNNHTIIQNSINQIKQAKQILLTAQNHYANKDWIEAQKLFKSLLMISPLSLEALTGHGKSSLRTSQYDEASLSVQMLTTMYPTNIESIYLSAKLSFLNNSNNIDLSQIVQLLKPIIDNNNNNNNNTNNTTLNGVIRLYKVSSFYVVSSPSSTSSSSSSSSLSSSLVYMNHSLV
eukprot:TRINITY_DN2686_c0_g1_i2.p1 TRINITY_DN2686_c0_g1~~TRINITY_DN2686_c0_g1_i2.p1  ORF type:complete len:562 (-),score=133.40 TRINITY_DN2686_c0_g1_i2:1055-2740(-)